MMNVGLIGFGYWGPNLARNFVECGKTNLLWICDANKDRLERAARTWPGVKVSSHANRVLEDHDVEAVAIATPVHTHFPLAKTALENGKHVLLEKPMALTSREGRELVDLAEGNGLRLMCDHTFCYMGVVQKMKEIVESGELGDVLYFDSVRINLGLFQNDVNVMWDLAPHDLSILDYLFGEDPIFVSAHAACHIQNNIENIAHLYLEYGNHFISHLHLNWLSPVKIRKMIVGGNKKMMVWNDVDPAEKLKIYDKGITLNPVGRDERSEILVSYRTGDMFAPDYDRTEALVKMVAEFAACIMEDRPSITDGLSGLRVLRVLEAAQESINAGGRKIPLDLRGIR